MNTGDASDYPLPREIISSTIRSTELARGSSRPCSNWQVSLNIGVLRLERLEEPRVNLVKLHMNNLVSLNVRRVVTACGRYHGIEQDSLYLLCLFAYSK